MVERRFRDLDRVPVADAILARLRANKIKRQADKAARVVPGDVGGAADTAAPPPPAAAAPPPAVLTDTFTVPQLMDNAPKLMVIAPPLHVAPIEFILIVSQSPPPPPGPPIRMHPFFVPRPQALAIPPPPLGQPISFSATIVPETPLPAQVAFIPPPPLQAHAAMSPPPPRLVHVRPEGRFKLKKFSQALPQLETAAPQQQDAAAPPQLEPVVLRMKLDYGFDVDCFFWC